MNDYFHNKTNTRPKDKKKFDEDKSLNIKNFEIPVEKYIKSKKVEFVKYEIKD